MAHDQTQTAKAEEEAGESMIDKITTSDTMPKEQPVKAIIHRTLCVYASFMGSGFCTGTFGPTLPQLVYYFDSDTQSVAWGLTTWSLGYMVGVTLCGAFYHRVHHELSQCLAIAIYSITMAICTFCGGLYAYLGLLIVFGIFQGFSYTAGIAYCFKLWTGNKNSKYIIQGSYLMWSVGATISPFVTRQFLVPLPEYEGDQPGQSCHMENTTTAALPGDQTNASFQLISELTGASHNVSGNDMRYTGFDGARIEGVGSNAALLTTTVGETLLNPTAAINRDIYAGVRFAYFTNGCIAFIPAIIFATTLCKNRKGLCQFKLKQTKTIPSEQDATAKDGQIKRTKAHVLVHVLLFAFVFFYQIVEITTFSLIAAFAIKEMCWANKKAALVWSLFSFSHGLGRLAGVPNAKFLSPKAMLLVDLGLQLAAYVMMLFVAKEGVLMWVSGAMAGFGMGTVYASLLLHLSDFIRVTGRTSCVVMTAASVGGMIGPALVGYLFDSMSPKWFVYVTLGGVLLQTGTFIILDIYTKLTMKKNRTL